MAFEVKGEIDVSRSSSHSIKNRDVVWSNSSLAVLDLHCMSHSTKEYGPRMLMIALDSLISIPNLGYDAQDQISPDCLLLVSFFPLRTAQV